MFLKKWDYSTHSYRPYEIPDDWVCKWFTISMYEKINCCQCGKKIPYCKSYFSLEVSSSVGLGCAVCEGCYDKEIIRKQENKEDF